jgi:hypothetical protein
MSAYAKELNTAEIAYASIKEVIPTFIIPSQLTAHV